MSERERTNQWDEARKRYGIGIGIGQAWEWAETMRHRDRTWPEFLAIEKTEKADEEREVHSGETGVRNDKAKMVKAAQREGRK